MKYVVCHIKNQRTLHLYLPFDKALRLLLYLLSDQPDLSLSYDHDTTSDISSSPVRSALITPEPGSDLTSLPDLQLLPPLCKAPSSSVAKSLGRQLCHTYSTQPKKVCVKRTEQRVLLVKQRRGEQGVHQSCLSNVSKGYNVPFFFSPCLLQPSPSPQLILILTNTLSNLKAWSAEKIKTMWPCCSLCLSCSQKDGAQIS